MSYASENYGGQQGYGNDSEPDEIDELQDKYGLDGTNSKSQYQSSNQSKSDAQVRAAAAADKQARSNINDATLENGRNSLYLAGKRDDQNFVAESNSRKLIEGIDKDKVDVENKFKSSESKLDRDKSIDEFTQNRYQTKQNQAQDRANLEYNTAQGLIRDRQAQESNLALADRANNVNLNIANITQRTELAGQAGAIDRARLAANAQIKAALFAPRQYSGY